MSHEIVLDDRRRTELMISTAFDIEKVKRSTAIFGLKALQKLSDRRERVHWLTWDIE